MRRTLGLALALAGTLTAVGCGDTSATGLVIGGNGSTIITVSSGVTPTYAWTGGGARRLTVTQSSGGGLLWDIEALNAGGFAPPVVHGVVPVSARENSNNVILTQGVDYRINISLVDGGEGTRVFRP